MASQDATMMGGPEVTLDQQLEHKKRKSDRACDFCRRRKSECDGDQVSRKSCSNCTLNNLQCTFHDTAKRQVISKTYVESLERRIEELEGMLERQQSLSPTRSADSPASTHTSASCPLSQEQLREMYCAVIRDDQRSKIPPYISSETIEEDADRGHGEFNPQDDDLNTTFRHLRLGPSFNRFLGKSSTAHLVLKIFSLKKKNSGEPYRVPPTFLDGRRPRYWQPHPWEYSLLQTEPARYSFPDEDLAKELIDLYFENVQPYFPILHRPTLEQGMRASEHLKDHNFGAIVLLVCALGARFSEDPRVLSKEYPSETHSRGWEWFSQAEKERRPVYTAPTLHEMQSFCLSIVFMLAASNLMAQHIWTRVGTGIRYIQDTGAHRRTTRKIPTNSDELWNRAVWLLIVLDRHLSSILGRSTAIQDEVFDIRYPMECDDEYWYNPDNPEESWKQPADKPSIVSGFVTYIKLTRMVEIAIRTIYGINKSGVISKFMGEEWERNVVRELDSALNRWVENVPEHLRWNPEQPDFRFLNQAAYLEAAYRQTQILIHRPFITSSKPSSQLALPSLTICTTAARACAHVLDQQRHKTGKALPYAMVSFPSSISATVLLISMFSRCEPTRSRRDQLKELKEIHLMMDYLKSLEDRWVTAGRTWDVLNELCHFGDMPNSQLGKRHGRVQMPKTVEEVFVPCTVGNCVQSSRCAEPVELHGVTDLRVTTIRSAHSDASTEQEHFACTRQHRPRRHAIVRGPLSRASHWKRACFRCTTECHAARGLCMVPTSWQWRGTRHHGLNGAR
ncbi:fungal-specific transcription factor domain-containing protein [Schizophyllum amplum]|uniref:Fungal-specific transcription factor domain-containing protein n=1 Tax=Schizophyllum amplum TaxID=97359 RepID=A0A550CM70_9AGAR|nr:fungal-specific transcription factor domain-containing protein [Auriculariopsis ampla]